MRPGKPRSPVSLDFASSLLSRMPCPRQDAARRRSPCYTCGTWRPRLAQEACFAPSQQPESLRAPRAVMNGLLARNKDRLAGGSKPLFLPRAGAIQQLFGSNQAGLAV